MIGVTEALLTGIPRSGTTLACSLLNRLPDTVALNEPMEVHNLPGSEKPSQLTGAIQNFLENQRHSILDQGSAMARVAEGLSDDNTFSPASDSNKARESIIRRSEVPISKNLPSDFLLVIKHPNVLAAALPVLADSFPCFALVRDPVSVISSWRTLPIPLAEGHVPAAEAMDPDLKQRLFKQDSVLDRQLVLLDWYFQRFTDHLPPGHIIRYEDVIGSGGRALHPMNPLAGQLDCYLENRNVSETSATTEITQINERIHSTAGAWRKFYP